MLKKRVLQLLASTLVGLILAAQVSAGGTVCPPDLPQCPLGNYGRYGPSVWLCCRDATHTDCVNYYKQAYICNYSDPGEPVSYGYDITVTHNTLSFNCDTVDQGNCY